MTKNTLYYPGFMKDKEKIRKIPQLKVNYLISNYSTYGYFFLIYYIDKHSIFNFSYYNKNEWKIAFF